MSELKRVQDIIIKEYQNLNKSKSRTRTFQGILEKRQNLQDNFREYYRLVKASEQRLSVTEWNSLVDTFNEVCFALLCLETVILADCRLEFIMYL